jgi:transposase
MILADLAVMVNRSISADMKKCALELAAMGWELEDVADILGVSTRSIERWQANMRDHGSVNRPPTNPIGRPRVMSAVISAELVDLLKEVPSM